MAARGHVKKSKARLRKMEVALWKRLPSPPLPRYLSRLILLGASSLLLLGLMARLTGWKWFGRRRKPSPRRVPGGDDHQNNTASTSFRDGAAAYSSNSRGEEQATPFGAHQTECQPLPTQTLKSRPSTTVNLRDTTNCSHLPETSQLSRSSKEPPRAEDTAQARYPTASSDVQSDSFSELDSIASSEDLSLENNKSATNLLDSGNPSPSLIDNSALIGRPIKRGVIQASSSAPILQSPKTQTPKPESPLQVLQSRSTPVFAQSTSRGHRIKVVVQIPKYAVGRFIGKQGRNIKSLMADSNGAYVYVNQKNLPEDVASVPCCIQGDFSQVEEALKIMAMKFPEIEIPSNFDNDTSGYSTPTSPFFASPSQNEIEDPWSMELKPSSLPASPFYAMVSYIEGLNCIWLVPYESSSAVEELHQSMSFIYSQPPGMGSPSHLVEQGDSSIVGKFCAVKVSDIHWLRGKVLDFGDDGVNYSVRLVDYGSSVIVPSLAVKPLR